MRSVGLDWGIFVVVGEHFCGADQSTAVTVHDVDPSPLDEATCKSRSQIQKFKRQRSNFTTRPPRLEHLDARVADVVVLDQPHQVALHMATVTLPTKGTYVARSTRESSACSSTFLKLDTLTTTTPGLSHSMGSWYDLAGTPVTTTSERRQHASAVALSAGPP